jgi:tetratricopeptide (TPR) repeat protein
MMPGNDEAYMWRGWVSRRAGLWEQAVQSMQAALKLNPRVHFNWHEYAITLMYLHRYEEANRAVKQARVIDPDSFWGKTTEARIALQERGDTDAAVKLTIGAQHGDDYDFFESYMLVNLLARRFEDALAAARNLPNDLEIQYKLITLREDWAAQTLHFMGNADEAKQAAGAALFRLKGLHTQLGEDHRIDLAEARIRALQGAAAEEVRALVQKSISSVPADDLAAFKNRVTHAQIFAIAGMAPEAVDMLESVLKPPSATSVFMVDLDPAFDSIRDDPEFMAMMERNR